MVKHIRCKICAGLDAVAALALDLAGPCSTRHEQGIGDTKPQRRLPAQRRWELRGTSSSGQPCHRPSSSIDAGSATESTRCSSCVGSPFTSLSARLHQLACWRHEQAQDGGTLRVQMELVFDASIQHRILAQAVGTAVQV